MTSTVVDKLVAWGPALAYAGLIFAVSSIPAHAMPPGAFWDFDKLIHGAEYAVLAGLLFRALHRTTSWSVEKTAGIAWLGAAVYGVSDEWHQSFTGRFPSAGDALADAIGALLMVVLLWRWARDSR